MDLNVGLFPNIVFWRFAWLIWMLHLPIERFQKIESNASLNFTSLKAKSNSKAKNFDGPSPSLFCKLLPDTESQATDNIFFFSDTDVFTRNKWSFLLEYDL